MSQSYSLWSLIDSLLTRMGWPKCRVVSAMSDVFRCFSLRCFAAAFYDCVLYSTIAYYDVMESIAFVPETGLYVGGQRASEVLRGLPPNPP
jgi:hypothetical protein